MTYTSQYLAETIQMVQGLDQDQIEEMATLLARVRAREGRVFVIGVGGSAANASHFVNDLRKIAHIDASTPVDNVAELTARTNDDGWSRVFVDWLRVSRLSAWDVLFVLSVGGGTDTVSPNLVKAINEATSIGATILGVVGREGGHTKHRATACVVVPTVHLHTVTPHAEEAQGIVCHLLVSHPRVRATA